MAENLTPKIKACGVLLVRGEPIEAFLLMRHPARYDLPKGHLDHGETELECALRETEEETGIPRDAIEVDPHFRFTTNYPVQSKKLGGAWADKTLVVFLGRLRRETPVVVTEHTGYEWFPWNPPHQIQKNTIDPLLAQLEAYLSGSGRAPS